MNKPDPLSLEAYIAKKLADAGISMEPDDSEDVSKSQPIVNPEESAPDAGVDATTDPMTEGAVSSVTLDRHERSRSARQACIAAHGSACAICGFEFAKTYGSHFAGIIQVHHIVPLHQVPGNHAVDPVRDLIPVCPNCHVALHSKPRGETYLPDELRDLMNRPSHRPI